MHNKKHRQVCGRLPSLRAFHIAINISPETYITELHFTRETEVMNARSCLSNSKILDSSSLYSYWCVPTSVNGACIQFTWDLVFDIFVLCLPVLRYCLHLTLFTGYSHIINYKKGGKSGKPSSFV